MADCSDLEARLKRAEEELAAAKKLERSVEGEAAAEAAAAKGKKSDPETFRTFSMADGTKMRIDPKEFYRQVEADNLAMGEDELKRLVQSNFDKKVKPKGSKSLNINYSEMPFDKQNVVGLLEVMGQTRAGTDFGQELAMPFTKNVANDALIQEIALKGGNVEEIARDLTKTYKPLDKLPTNMVLVQRMKMDSTRHYADMLEDAADLVETFGLSPERKAGLARASQYAHFFEQLDALYARKTAQALRARAARNFDLADELEGPLSYEDVYKLDIDTMEPGSLAAQVLDAIETGNADELRKIAIAKRVEGTNDIPINESNVMTQVRILNNVRKDNLFLSPSTWMQRNVLSGALINFSNGMEDFYEVVWRTQDLKQAWETSMFAGTRMAMGFSSAWGNALQLLQTGKSTFTRAGMKEGLDPQSLVNRKQNTTEQMKQAAQQLNAAWNNVFGENPMTGPVALMNLMNSGARYALGTAIEKAGLGTGGYMPAFTLLGGGDEITRKMAFDWKASFSGYQNAIAEWDALDVKPKGVSKAEWVGQRATERSDAAVFNGLMTDDELVALRRRAGATQYGDMSNEQLRLKIFNDQNGLPNPGTLEGAAGLERAADATFTGRIKGQLGSAIQMARQNPIIGWIIPTYQTAHKSLAWTFDHDVFVRMPIQLAMEARQQGTKLGNMVRKTDVDVPFSDEEMALARAKTLNAAALATATNFLWQTGIFTDGGSFNPDQNKRENSRIPPYSFSLGTLGVLGMSKLTMAGRTIDLVDLMGLQADIMRALHENFLEERDAPELLYGVVQGYARMLESKQTLSSVLDLMNAAFRTAQGQSVDWAQVMGSQMNGILPLSGALTSGSRSFQDPNQIQAGRRELSQTELDALGKDQNFMAFKKFAQKIARNYPGLGQAGYEARSRDWLGRERRRVFGLPYDVVAPFAPIISSDTPLDRWLEKHGLGAVPHANGKVSGADLRLTGAAATQMSNEEELTYRQAMWSIKGEVPAESILGKSAIISTGLGQYNINNYVKGRTLQQALTALSNDPEYNLDLESPNSPSIANTQLPYAEQSLSNRKKSINDPRGVYKVYDAIITYYDQQALGVMAQAHPDFVTKAMANWGVKQERIMEDLEQQPLGLSRQ